MQDSVYMRTAEAYDSPLDQDGQPQHATIRRLRDNLKKDINHDAMAGSLMLTLAVHQQKGLTKHNVQQSVSQLVRRKLTTKMSFARAKVEKSQDNIAISH